MVASNNNNNKERKQPNQTGSQVGTPRNRDLQRNGPEDLKGRNRQNAGSALAEKPMYRKGKDKHS